MRLLFAGFRPLASGFWLLACAALAPAAHAITAAALHDRLQAGERFLLVDVRTGTAYTEAHIPGALNIPLTLLPHKKLPAGVPVIAYTDGLGLLSETDALAAIRQVAGGSADILEGGFAAWQTHTRMSTAASGVQREKLPGITYDQLVAADKTDMVIVDLRAGSSAAAAAAPAAPGTVATAAAPAPDLVATFADRLGVPVQQGTAAAAPAPADPRSRSGTLAAASAPSANSGRPPLLVLVADDEATANEAARRLRAAGNHRFTILIGGTEIIKYDGRRGMSRQGGELPVVSGAP